MYLRRFTRSIYNIYSRKRSLRTTPGTLRQYRKNFHYFIGYLNEKDIAHNLSAFDTDIIRNYVLYMRNEKVKFEGHRFKKEKHMTIGLSESTVNTRLKTLRAFSRYLYEKRILDENPLPYLL
ncbi:phage integrase SAM-like domain-containing protein [Bacillus sp. DE0042]|uniref:phage integrase SAM-like domain-containing protein n=1 Tax=Bacillus sp. DE0042 TaxID=2584950 RepID=UPI0021B557C2|nr:phage integrase SAM-like domain-containing protein [Bacillus sp. DE0042]